MVQLTSNSHCWLNTVWWIAQIDRCWSDVLPCPGDMVAHGMRSGSTVIPYSNALTTRLQRIENTVVTFGICYAGMHGHALRTLSEPYLDIFTCIDLLFMCYKASVTG